MTMRAGVCTVLGIGVILIAAPAWAAEGRYDPDYPVCMEAISSEGTRIDCIYTSIEQCRQGTVGSSGSCFKNPSYVPRPAEAAPAQTEPAPAAKPAKSTGRYDPDYPVCMEVYGSDGSRIECFFTSMEQCKLGATGTAGTCFNNPYYVQPPADAAAAAQTESAPSAKPAKPIKPAKSAKSAKSLQSPPAPQPAQLQQR
jgi:hypothetical protein